jgi:hypothetical protein
MARILEKIVIIYEENSGSSNGLVPFTVDNIASQVPRSPKQHQDLASLGFGRIDKQVLEQFRSS